MRNLKIQFLFLFLVGCSLAPTKMYETKQLDVRQLEKMNDVPLVIEEDSVIIDTRSSFDYAMAHVPQSINIAWDEFSDPKASHKGFLNRDLFKEARRLALKGISPKSKIIVLGNGQKGEGEEGRLAWTLLYMGIPQVQFASLDYFNKQLSNTESPPLKNAAVWKPVLAQNLLTERNEIRDLIKNPKVSDERVFLIDVRSPKEYFNKQVKNAPNYPDINAINIEWKEFLTDKGRPNSKMKAKLAGLGITKNSKVILISNQGVRSAAVTAAMLSLGYKNVSNYAGGMLDLFSK